MNVVPAVAYHLCLNLPAAFAQPVALTFADRCKSLAQIFQGQRMHLREAGEVKARRAVALLQDDLVGALEQTVGHLVPGMKKGRVREGIACTQHRNSFRESKMGGEQHINQAVQV